MKKFVELEEADANTVRAILLTHAAMQDQGAAQQTEIQARLHVDEPGTEMIKTLGEQVDDLEEDAVDLRRLAMLFA